MEEVNDPETLERIEENDTEEIRASAKRHHELTAEGLKALREATVEEITEGDKEVERAMVLFFSNRVLDSEELFEKKMGVDPLHALGSACISTIKAMLSLSKADIDIALERLALTITFADELVSSGEGLLGKMSRMFRKNNTTKRLLPGEFRAKAILADAYCFRGFLLLLQQNSLNGIVKGGMALNRSYSLFKSLTNELEELKAEKKINSYEITGLDRNSVYSALTGCGCINVVMSILPPRLLRILNFLGFSYDRDLGMELVSQCWKSKTLYAPLAGLFLMVFNSFIPGFCSMLVPQCVPLAKAMAKEMVERPPTNGSLIHLWLVGRIYRLDLNMDESIRILSRCLDEADKRQIAEAMPQLRDFAVYDQAWNYAACMQWEDCIKCHAHLEENSSWSKLFYAYAQACAYEMLLYEVEEKGAPDALKYGEKATEAYWRAAHHCVTVMGGRTVAIESFLAHRLKDVFSYSGVQHPNYGNKTKVILSAPRPPNNAQLRNIVRLPMLELFVLFDLIHQLAPSYIEGFINIIDKALGSNVSSLTETPQSDVGSVPQSPSTRQTAEYLGQLQKTVLLCIKAVALTHIHGKEDIALKLIQRCSQASRAYKGRQCTVSWMYVWMVYEEATLAFRSGDMKKSAKLFDVVDDINEKQIFRTAMETKLHFARWAIRDAKRAK